MATTNSSRLQYGTPTYYVTALLVFFSIINMFGNIYFRSIYIDVILMPLSLAGSFYLVVFSRSIYYSVCISSAYVGIWAGSTSFFLSSHGRHNEYFYIMLCFLFLTTASYFEKRLLSIIATFCSLGVVGMATGITFSTSSQVLGLEMQPDKTGTITIVWVWMLRSYLMINNILWGAVFGKLIRYKQDTDTANSEAQQYTDIADIA